MTSTDKTPNSEYALRQRAETVAQTFALEAQASSEAMSPHAMLVAIHELRVHQIELEMQNEELRRTQAERDAAQARYFDFYDLAPVGYVTVAEHGLILHANLTAAAMLGVPRSNLSKQRLNHFIDREDQDAYYLLQRQLTECQQPRSSELRMKKEDGHRFFARVDAIAATGDHGEPVLRLVLIDISECKRLEDRLIRDETKLKTILDGASDAIFINDSQGNFQYINEQAMQMLGYSREELLHMGVTDLVSTEAGAATRQMLARLMTQGSLRSELILRRKNGSTLPVELSGRLLADGSGFAACRDITERIQLQTAQLAIAIESESATSRQQLRELIALNQATREEERKHIAREVHDELGQVLTALRMNLSLSCSRFGELDPALHSDLKGAKALVDQAIQGVRNVATHLRPVALDMGLLPAIEWLCQEFNRTNTLTRCSFDAQGCLDLDESRAVVVFRIVQESLTNITRHAKASNVDVTLNRQGYDLRLKIRDSGRGFDASTTSKKHSFGLLGMRERAITLGGSLDITSEPGIGTVVDLTIPFQLFSYTGQL